MRYENAFLNTQWKAEELFKVSSQLFISYKQNQSILLWRSTFNLKSGVPASATWPRERHDMRSMYIVVLMTSGKRSWPQERLVLKLSNSRHLARKYARIFVRGHYLFRETNSFPRAYNVQLQISEHLFAPNGVYCLYYLSNLFATRAVLKIGEYSRIFPSLTGEYSVTWRVSANRA